MKARMLERESLCVKLLFVHLLLNNTVFCMRVIIFEMAVFEYEVMLYYFVL